MLQHSVYSIFIFFDNYFYVSQFLGGGGCSNSEKHSEVDSHEAINHSEYTTIRMNEQMLHLNKGMVLYPDSMRDPSCACSVSRQLYYAIYLNNRFSATRKKNSLTSVCELA